MLVRCEAIITQLVFDHSLRIRMKAETAESPSPSRATTAAQTPDNASIAEAEPDEGASGSQSSEDGTTVRASTLSGATATTAKGKEPAKKGEDDKEKEKEKKEEPAGSGNLVGKINNLVTTDLANIIDGRDFLFLGAYIDCWLVLRRIYLSFIVLVLCSVVCAVAGWVVSVLFVGHSWMEVRSHLLFGFGVVPG